MCSRHPWAKAISVCLACGGLGSVCVCGCRYAHVQCVCMPWACLLCACVWVVGCVQRVCTCWYVGAVCLCSVCVVWVCSVVHVHYACLVCVHSVGSRCLCNVYVCAVCIHAQCTCAVWLSVCAACVCVRAHVCTMHVQCIFVRSVHVGSVPMPCACLYSACVWAVYACVRGMCVHPQGFVLSVCMYVVYMCVQDAPPYVPRLLPDFRLDKAATRAGSMSQGRPAAVANSKMLRVTWGQHPGSFRWGGRGTLPMAGTPRLPHPLSSATGSAPGSNNPSPTAPRPEVPGWPGSRLHHPP